MTSRYLCSRHAARVPLFARRRPCNSARERETRKNSSDAQLDAGAGVGPASDTLTRTSLAWAEAAQLGTLGDEARAVNDVWVFNGATNHCPSAVFENRESAEEWIQANALTGTLTRYPVGQSVYDWAMARGSFTPKSAPSAGVYR